VDWSDLRFVLATAKAGTLSGAARELGVTHTTVARRLKALDERLGARVFDQRSDGFVLTAEGEAIFALAVRFDEEVVDLERRLLGRDARLTGLLRVTTVDMFFDWFARDFAEFVKRYPGVEMELAATIDPKNLTRRDADVALRATNQPPEHLVGRKVGRMEFAVFAAKSLVGSPARELASYPWLGWEERARARVTDRWMAENVPGARVALRIDSPIVMRRALEAGIGIAAFPCFEGDANPELERVTPVLDDFGMDVWLLTHPDLKNTARVVAFIHHMAEALAQRQAALSGRLPMASWA